MKKELERKFISFLKKLCYKLLSCAYLTLYYLPSHLILFLVSVLSVTIADFYIISSHLPFTVHQHFFFGEDQATLCVLATEHHNSTNSYCIVLSLSL